MYLIRLAFRPWRMAPGTQILTTLTLGGVLFFSSFFLWAYFTISPVAEKVKKEQVVTAYFEQNMNTSQEGDIVRSIQSVVGSGVELSVTSPQQFLKEIEVLYPNLRKELLTLGNEVNSVLPKFVSVSGDIPQSVISSIESIPLVSHVETSVDRYKPIIKLFSLIKVASGWVSITLLFVFLASLFLLLVINRSYYSKAIEVFQQMGGDGLINSLPGIFSGASTGFLAGLISGVLWIFTFPFISKTIISVSPLLSDIALPLYSVAFYQIVIATLLGSVVGLFSSFGVGRIR